MALMVVMAVMPSMLAVTRYADLVRSDPFGDQRDFHFLPPTFPRQISCKNDKDCREKRSADGLPDLEILDYFTEDSSDVYTELEETDAEAEEDARMMQINELLKMIESQEKAGGESCTPGTELELGENIVDSYGKVTFFCWIMLLKKMFLLSWFVNKSMFVK